MSIIVRDACYYCDRTIPREYSDTYNRKDHICDRCLKKPASFFVNYLVYIFLIVIFILILHA